MVLAFAIILTIICFSFLLIKVWYKNIILLINFVSQKNVESKIQEAESTEQYKEKNRIQEETLRSSQELQHKKQLLNVRNQMISEALMVVRDFKAKYPYAQEELFSVIMEKYHVSTVDDISEMENNIKESHNKNKHLFEFGDSNKTYTLDDLNGVEPIEKFREDPLVLSIYSMQEAFVVVIRDIDTNSYNLYQAKEYSYLRTSVNNFLEKQRNNKFLKSNIIAEKLS